MAYIEWEDAQGTGTLGPSYPEGPARRFRGWTPNARGFGPHTYGLGTGRRFEFRFRIEQTATFQIPGILPSQFEDFLRFKLAALAGCPFLVVTEDADENIYECYLAPETVPELEQDDAQLLEYTATVVAMSADAAPMLCNYRG